MCYISAVGGMVEEYAVNLPRAAERLCWLLGLALLTAHVAARTDATLGHDQALETFRVAQASLAAGGESLPTPDQSAWASGRIAAWKQSLTVPMPAPEGVLHFPTLNHSMPVFDGTDELALNRGVGRIEGTAALDASGNVGIAGHRDGYFRILKGIEVGDRVELETLSGRRSFRVAETMIVDPSAVHVLEPSDTPVLTLVTCYPFYFVGHAPQRFIVRAVLDGVTSTSMQ